MTAATAALRSWRLAMEGSSRSRQAPHTGSNTGRRQADKQSRQAGSAGCRHASTVGVGGHVKKIAAQKGILAWHSMQFVLHKGILAYARFWRLREIMRDFQKTCPTREFLRTQEKQGVKANRTPTVRSFWRLYQATSSHMDPFQTNFDSQISRRRRRRTNSQIPT